MMEPLERQAMLQSMMQQQPPQSPQNPLTSGAVAAMDNIKRAMALDNDQQRQSLGAAIQHFSAGMGNPANHQGGVLGAAAASMSPAITAYQQANQQGQSENMQAFEIMQALEKQAEDKRRQAMDEKHKSDQLDETRRYHNLMGGKSGSRSSNPYYGMPALAKHMKIQEEIDSGFLPGSNGENPLTPEQQKQYTAQNQLAMQKITTDSQTRNRALFANNLYKTIENTNVDDLTRYSGIKGAWKLKQEQARDLAGQPSEEYLKYKEALTAVKLEAKELRQFLGESITPEIQKSLENLTNPTGTFTSAETAKHQIEKSRDVIKKQLETYQSALKSTRPYNKESSEVVKFSPEQYDFASRIRVEQPDATKGMSEKEIIEWGMSRGKI